MNEVHTYVLIWMCMCGIVRVACKAEQEGERRCRPEKSGIERPLLWCHTSKFTKRFLEK